FEVWTGQPTCFQFFRKADRKSLVCIGRNSRRILESNQVFAWSLKKQFMLAALGSPVGHTRGCCVREQREHRENQEKRGGSRAFQAASYCLCPPPRGPPAPPAPPPGAPPGPPPRAALIVP